MLLVCNVSSRVVKERRILTSTCIATCFPAHFRAIRTSRESKLENVFLLSFLSYTNKHDDSRIGRHSSHDIYLYLNVRNAFGLSAREKDLRTTDEAISVRQQASAISKQEIDKS